MNDDISLNLSEEDIERANHLFMEKKQILERLGRLDAAYLKSLIPPTVPTPSIRLGAQ